MEDDQPMQEPPQHVAGLEPVADTGAAGPTTAAMATTHDGTVTVAMAVERSSDDPGEDGDPGGDGGDASRGKRRHRRERKHVGFQGSMPKPRSGRPSKLAQVIDQKQKAAAAAAAAASSGALLHMSYTCPGLHGPGTRQDIAPQAMSALLAPGQPSVIIPLFQRRYCWVKQLAGWWRDIAPGVGPGFAAGRGRGGSRGGGDGRGGVGRGGEGGNDGDGHDNDDDDDDDDDGAAAIARANAKAARSMGAGDTSGSRHRHRVGKIYFKQQPAADGGDLICIDGQQRLTTTMLYTAAVRDACLALSPVPWNLVAEAERALFRDPTALQAWLDATVSSVPRAQPDSTTGAVDERAILEWWNTQQLAPGTRLGFATLIPSFADREAFFSLLTEARVRHAARQAGLAMPSRLLSAASRASLQAGAYSFFSGKIQEALARSGRAGGEAALVLKQMLQSGIDGVSLMRIDVINDVNLGQVFLWLQEKSLFGMGALLYNPSPGEDFHAGDMVRNLLFAPMMDLPLQEQERLFRELWIEPIEMRVPDATTMDQLVVAYLDREYSATKQGGYRSSLENMLELMPALPGKDKLSSRSGIKLYARFLSYYEQYFGLDKPDAAPVRQQDVSNLLQYFAEHLFPSQ